MERKRNRYKRKKLNKNFNQHKRWAHAHRFLYCLYNEKSGFNRIHSLIIFFCQKALRLDLFHYKRLKGIALADIVELFDSDTALVALGYLLDVILKSS